MKTGIFFLAAILTLVFCAVAFAAYTGTNGDDVFTGGPGTNTAYMLGGNDTAWMQGGSDYVEGNGGNDYLVLGSGSNEYAYGNTGADTIYAGCPNNGCDPGNFNYLYGGDGADSLRAQNGNHDHVDCGTDSAVDEIWVDDNAVVDTLVNCGGEDIIHRN